METKLEKALRDIRELKKVRDYALDQLFKRDQKLYKIKEIVKEHNSDWVKIMMIKEVLDK